MRNREAFKQRMQTLKSYRESNPGKGYWDWKQGTEEGRIGFMERLAKSKAKEWNVNEDEVLLEMLNDNTYNYKQMYYDNPNYDIKKGHFSDTYKTVYHPTFSEESMYSGNKSQYNPDGITGGSWDYDNKVFRANPKQNTKETQQYLDREDPGWKVQTYADGGTTGDPEKEQFFQATGRSRSGRPLEQGLKPVFDLEDAAGMTPIGDVMSARDTYNAVRQKDWLGAGLAAVSALPFVPMTVRNFRKSYKGVTPKFNTTVNKKAVSNAIDAFDVERARRQAIIDSSADLIPKANNQGYKVAERLMEDPDYITRAAEVQKKFGDDYLTTYADILQAYNEDPSKLLKADFKFYPDKSQGRAAVEVSEEAIKRHKAGGEFAKMGEYNYRIDPSRTDLSGNVTEHEWNHYVDFLKNKSPGADGNSNMFYQMSKDLNGVKIDSNDLYFAKPTEQKAYMNQLREYLFNSGKISRRGDKVSPSLLKKELERLSEVPEYSSAVRASKQFGSNAKYTKWFNTIPLLGVGAIGANKYFTEEKNNNNLIK